MANSLLIRSILEGVADRRLAVMAFVALAVACQSGAQKTPAAGDTSADSSVCRGPSQPGCERCCEQALSPDGETHMCSIASRITTPAARGAPRGYNDRRLEVGPCAPSCRPCAPCTEEEADRYAAMVASGCNCASVKPSIDPCYFPEGCDCRCQGFAEVANCAPEVPAPGNRD